MQDINENRQNLYNNLLSDGYFRGGDGEVNFSFEDFCSSLDDRDNVETFYNNLIDDGYFRDEQGEINIDLVEFTEMVSPVTNFLDHYPITENQRGIFIDWDMNRDSIQYNIPVLDAFPGVSAERLAEALRTVVNAHPYLKVHLKMRDGDLVQVRRDDVPAVVSVHHLDSKPDHDFFQQRIRPFNVLEEDLYRLDVYDFGDETWLLRDMHHLIYDGGSDLFFMQDLQTVLAGGDIETEKFTAYDHAIRENSKMSSPEYQEAEAYFDKLINGVSSTVYPVSATHESEENLAGSISVLMDKPQINAFCREQGITMHSFFLASTEQALHNMTGEKDVQLITIHNGRTDQRMMGIMGMFVKTVPVVSHLAVDGVSLADVAKEVQKQFLKIQTYDFYPYTHVVNRHGLSAQIMFDFIDLKTAKRPDEEERIKLTTAKYPLVVDICEYADCFEVKVGYDMSLYCAEDMTLLGEAVKNIALGAAANSKAPLASLPVMDASKLRETLALSQGESIEFDYPETFVRQFVSIARKLPDSLAVADDSASYSYGELDRRSNALAHILVNNGVVEKSFVGVLLDRTIDFPLCVLGVLKSGAAYIPIDTEYPADRINYMLSNSEAKVLLTNSRDINALKREKDINLDGFKVLCIDELPLDGDSSVIDKSTADGIAYMIYTSGSTGTPKGAMLHHRGLRNFICSLVRAEELSGKDIVASHRSFSFDAFIGDLYPILSVGGQLHIMPSAIRKDLDSIYNFIIERQVSGFGCTTSLMTMLVNNYDLPLRFITAGGEKLAGVKSDKMIIINEYGPTECTNDSTIYKIRPGEETNDIPIGRPLPNTQCLVLSPYGQPLPAGVPGELCICGTQVGYGYWKLPELTNKTFVPNPFGEGKMYHTGDLVRYNVEGNIDYLGRIDFQVKLRGYRIDMGEIESKVSDFDGIRQCVAAVVEANGGKHLACFYVKSDGASVSKDALAEYLEGTSLPSYMLPEAYVELNEMPLLPNGKVNRRQLPKVELSAEDTTSPDTETEKVLYDIALELFKLERIGVNASLMTIGLTSLTAMKFGAIVKQNLGKNLPTKEILKLKTIRQIASFLDSSSAEKAVAAAVRPQREYYPISENQRGVYIDWEMNRDALQYNLPDVSRIGDCKNSETLRDAIVRVVNAHPYLKTRLAMKDGDIVQLRQDDEPVVVDVIKTAKAPTPVFFQSRVRPFDLFNDRLYRFEIYDTPEGLFLFKDIHHLIFDGGSEYLFDIELKKALAGEALTTESYTAFDRALDEQELMASDEFSRTERYFDSVIGDAEMISYPHSDRPDASAAGKKAKNAYVDVEIPCAEIDRYSASNGVTSNIFFMTSLMQVLHRLTREERIAITTISNGRSDERLFGCMGMFVKTLPVVSVFDAEKNLDACVKEMSDQFIETQSRDFYPFTRLAERYGFRSEIMYIFQGGMVVVDSQNEFDVNLDTTKMPLAISVTQTSNGNYHINFEYDTAIYNQSDIRVLADSLVAFAKNALKNSGEKLKAIALVEEPLTKELISLSKGRELPYDETETFVSMVSRFGEETPDALAVEDENGLLTYAELNRESDALASYLLDQGLKAGSFVGVMLPRIKEFIVSILAIQKAGAAYVPMDSEYPEDRLRHMLTDSEAGFLVTTKTLYEAKHSSGGFDASNVIYIESFDFDANYAGKVNNAHPDGLAYMIYTSGSTGTPKGVMLPHRALRAFLAWRIAEIGINSSSRHAQHASFSFDASLDDLLCPLAAGGSVHIMPESLRKDIEGIRLFIKTNGITGMTLSTALGMALLGQYNDLPVKFLMMGGEKMLPFQKTDIKVINGYGPTEFSVCSSFHIVDQDQDKDIPIGRPVPNSYSFICDSFGNLLPQGAAGEICLCGRQMALGYWKREELTGQKFCMTPFGYKVYHTGDLARWNANGELEFMGRIDNQVKLRGYRIELGEIENQAVLMDGINTACAQVREVNGSKHLVLYYTADAQISEDVLREHLSASLTEYMVPDTYMLLPEMPLTPNGKVNHRALPVPVIRSAAEYVEPGTDKERIVANLFATLLGLSQPVGALDNFFALGGDSIKSIRLVSSLRAEGYTIQVADIMKLKTVRDIAEGLTGGEVIEISQDAWSGEVPDTAIWKFFVDLNLPSPHHFNQSFVVQAAQRVDESALRSTVKALVLHHDMLRSIVRNYHLYVRGAEEPGAFGFETVDYTKADNWKELAESLCVRRQSGFNLEKGPLLHVTLFHLPDYDAILLACHHAVVDGVSWRILLEDFNTAYSQALSGGEISLPSKTHSYREYAETLHKYAESSLLLQEKEYWDGVQKKLESLPCSDAKNHSRSMMHVCGELDTDTTGHLLSDAGRPYNADINDLLLSAVGLSYYKTSGNRSVSVQFEGHGREYVGRDNLLTDRTVGWFTSVYPVILENLDADLRKLIRLTKETMHRIPNKGVGYNILRFLNQDTSYSSDSCAVIGFNYLGESSGASENAPFSITGEISCGNDFATDNVFGPDISINCNIDNGKLRMTLAYNADIYTENFANCFQKGILESLREISAHLKDKKELEVTASDLGELSWSDDEFETVYEHFRKIGTPIQRIYPLSPMQEGIMLKFLIEPDALSYRLVSRMSLDILPTEANLRYALDRLAAHHEVLRTSIIYRNVGQYRQAIVARKLGLAMLDYSKKPDIEMSMQKLYLKEQHRGFDMEEESLFRVTCVKTSDKTCELIIAVHHIIVDGWCIGLFTQDLVQGLAEAVTGRIQPIEAGVAGRYERYIHSIRQKDVNAGLDYWHHLLSGYTTQAVIPYSGLIPADQRSPENETGIKLEGAAMHKLVALAASEQITMNTLVELAWGIVLNIYNRQDDVVFVKVVSGRDSIDESVEDVVGLFINSIPVRVSLKNGQTVRQALHELQSQAAESKKWDFCPLSQIQQQSELGAQLFQSIFAYENYASDGKADDSLPFHLKMLYSKEESINDITVTAFSEGNESLTVNIKYDNTKYKVSDVARVAEVMQNILVAIGNTPDVEVNSITSIDEKMELELIELGREASLNFDRSKTLVDLFRTQAKRTPDSVCIVFKDRSYSYAQIDNITDRLAVLLQRNYRIKPEMTVGVMIDRSELMVIYPLAVMKAGAAYMPLDFHFPADRLEFMCKDAGVSLILSEGTRVQDSIPGYNATVISSDVLDTLDSVKGTLSSTYSPKPENMFVILYTSGSTGTPKGVMLEHRNIVNFCHWYVDEFDVTADDRVVAYANFGFDAHMLDIYPALSVGASVYIIPSEMRMDLMAMNEYMEKERLTLAFLTTQVGYMFATTIENHSLRLLSVGGEKLQPLKKPAFRFYNVYGPTECTLFSTFYNIDRDYDSSYIGRPLAGYQLYVVDHNMNMVPRGATGELVVAGAGVGRGYLNRPDINAEKFVTFRGMKAYRTGDLVRWSPDGNIDFIGRIDNQVKLRGLRIEMGEIEARASSYPGVSGVVVDVKEICGAQHICCYYTANIDIDIEDLKRYLAEKLADYMVPTAYTRMESFPLTPNGKVNRRALPVPAVSAQTENVPPANEREQDLFDIVAELLKTDNFGVTDDITKLGMTSLLGIKFVMMAAKKDIILKLDDVTKLKTIRGLSENNMNMVFWANGFTSDKPVVVLVCGATPYKNLKPYVEAMSSDFSVLVVEPTSAHYQFMFGDADINEVVELYYMLIDLAVSGARIAAFTGHCFGGEIAYRLAGKWNQEYGGNAPMIMLDVFWRIVPLHFDEETLLSAIPQDIKEKYGSYISSYSSAMMMYDSLGRQGKPEHYDGEIVLFRAAQTEADNPIMEEIYDAAPEFKKMWMEVTSERHMDNRAFWKTYYPEMEVYDVQGDHMSMLGADYTDEYVNWIKNHIARENND